MIRTLKDLVFLFWELPQNLSGLIFLIVLKFRKKVIGEKNLSGRHLVETGNIGVSLGWFVFFQSYHDPLDPNRILKHEMGHSEQSKYFGPAYLIIIGIPSFMRFVYSQLYKRRKGGFWPGYFKGFPENWADALGEKHYSKITYE